MKNELSDDLIIGFFEGTCSPEDKREVIRWSNKSFENKKALDELWETWIITKKLNDDFSPDVTKAWANVFQNIEENENIGRSNLYSKYSQHLLKIAAVFVVGFVLYFLLLFNSAENQFTEVLVAENSTQDLTLPDGSMVWLNDGSKLEFPKGFEGDLRQVKLSGEAYFQVVKNPSKPFEVLSEHSQVRVLGTSFNYATGKGDVDHIVLESGKVLFSQSNNDENSIILLPGEKAVLNKSTNNISKHINNDRNYLSWKTGILIFENDTLSDVVDKLTDHYSQSLEITNPEIEFTRLTVTFDNKEFEDVLKILELTLNVTIREDAGKIIIN